MKGEKKKEQNKLYGIRYFEFRKIAKDAKEKVRRSNSIVMRLRAESARRDIFKSGKQSVQYLKFERR